MRVFGSAIFGAILFLSAAASAADLKVKVVDPQSAAVAGVQVSLMRFNQSKALAVQTTSAEGAATFRLPGSGPYQIQVLAPGFASETVEVSSKTEITVDLHVAVAAETMVVSATRTPVPGEAAGSDVDTLNPAQLAAMQPIAANDAMRFLPGAVINASGQHGGLSSLFVRGGESNYNKVIVDGVTVNEPGGTFDFGTLSLAQGDRMEFVRGAQSTLYGTDAMTSVVQVWTRTGSSPTPELILGAVGGNLATASGQASLAGARGRYDYNLFGDQFNTTGSGVNDAYSNSLEGASLGARLSDSVSLRANFRHANSHTGVPGEWNFNGYVPLVPANGSSEPLVPLQPNPDRGPNSTTCLAEFSCWLPRLMDGSIASADSIMSTVTTSPIPAIPRASILPEIPSTTPLTRWTTSTAPALNIREITPNEAGPTQPSAIALRTRTDFVGDLDYGPQSHGQRLNQDSYVQQDVTLGRLGIIAGGRFIHDSAFGNTGVPRVALTLQALRGKRTFSGTRLRFSYATGFKEPRLEETFNGVPASPYNLPNSSLKPERVRAFEAGFQQNFLNNQYELTGTYFNNLFRDQINYVTENIPPNYPGQYVNVNQAFAQGAEVALRAKLRSRLLLNTAYTYTSSQYLDNPSPYDPIYDPGQPLLRRPKHSATALLSYSGSRWGASLGGSFVGRRADSDFYGFGIDHAVGYVRVDLGGFYAVRPRITVFANVENALDHPYNEVVGYPALPINFRAGMRFRIGGD